MTDAAAVLIDGPWEHRFVSANGARFHVALAGEGPLVLLLHGFPQFWWAWRAQLAGLAAAGVAGRRHRPTRLRRLGQATSGL